MARRRTKIIVKPGDRVLIGRPGVSMPEDWWFATVRWVDGEDMVIEHTPAGGTMYRQVMHVGYVRAVGEYLELRAYQEKCRALVKKKQAAVERALQRLAKARDAVWLQLDAFAEDARRISP